MDHQLATGDYWSSYTNLLMGLVWKMSYSPRNRYRLNSRFLSRRHSFLFFVSSKTLHVPSPRLDSSMLQFTSARSRSTQRVILLVALRRWSPGTSKSLSQLPLPTTVSIRFEINYIQNEIRLIISFHLFLAPHLLFLPLLSLFPFLFPSFMFCSLFPPYCRP